MIETLINGGPIVYILIVLSVCSIALIIIKTLHLRSAMSGGANRQKAFDLWGAGNKTDAINIIRSEETPAARILGFAMTGLLAGKPRSVLNTELEWRAGAEVSNMQRHIRLLELIAMISPLLGLLGTVLGMIQSFQELALAEGAANASLLAAGIWQALLTTAAGLVVAIPAAIGATLLSERVERATQHIEAVIGQLFTIEDANK